jgi:ariadne-1
MPWACAGCTYINSDGATSCEVCESEHGGASVSFMEEAEKEEEEEEPEQKQGRGGVQAKLVRATRPPAQPMEAEEWGLEEEWDDPDKEGEGDDGWGDVGSDDALMPSSPTPPDTVSTSVFGYTLLTQGELHKLMAAAVEEHADMLGLSSPDTTLLLRATGWDEKKLQDMWFNKNEEVRVLAGLPVRVSSSSSSSSGGDLACQVCFDEVSREESFALDCGHSFCLECWEHWVSAAADKGPMLLFTKCPGQTCTRRVPDEVLMRFCTGREAKDKLGQYILDSYVNSSATIKFCPGLICDLAVKYAGGGVQTVQCKCGHVWCFSCADKGHAPVTCDMAHFWNQKSVSDGGNDVWLTGNTKPCPKCKVRIEKNQGCQHMTCGSCRHEFCWMCLKVWSGHMQCNQYNGNDDPKEDEAVRARNELKRFNHFSDRFIAHIKSVRFAQDTLTKALERSEVLQTLKGTGPQYTDFILKAVEQVINCRRVLAWTYAFSFFLAAPDKSRERELFDMQQQQLEQFTDELHELAERDVEILVDDVDGARQKILTLTRVIRKYQGNVIDTIETAGLTTTLDLAEDKRNKKAGKGQPVKGKKERAGAEKVKQGRKASVVAPDAGRKRKKGR